MSKENDRSNPWAPYSATSSAPWNLRRVVHLHRRTGFAASWPELQRDLSDGPKPAIDRILAGRSRTVGIPADFEPVSNLLADAAVQSGDLHRLQAWWVYRMLFSPDPLAERLTLLWHNHFATSIDKVLDLRSMRRQNETHRRLARAPFADLLGAAVREPALLLYLDAPANRKGHPNENLARELMELFTLGIGHYAESDVKAAARTLTGWTLEAGDFRESPEQHDDGEKTIFGKTARWTGSDLIEVLANHPATAHRLATRLCSLFMGERAVDPPAVAALAHGLATNTLDIGWGIQTILRSQAFFAVPNIRTRVLGPAEFVIGACRTLLPPSPPPSTLFLAGWISQLGQDLFKPPNVGGWPEGRAWLTSRSIIGRTKFATALVEGRSIGMPAPIDVSAIATAQGRTTSFEDILDAISALLTGSSLSPEHRRTLAPKFSSLSPKSSLQAVASIVASSESQLA
jgi:uncharacterized protein (DUF1800 family)